MESQSCLGLTVVVGFSNAMIILALHHEVITVAAVADSVSVFS